MRELVAGPEPGSPELGDDVQRLAGAVAGDDPSFQPAGHHKPTGNRVPFDGIRITGR